MDFTDKANALANKLNELTEKFNLSNEMVLSGDDIIDDVKKKTDLIELNSGAPKLNETIDVEIEQEFNTSLVLELEKL